MNETDERDLDDETRFGTLLISTFFSHHDHGDITQPLQQKCGTVTTELLCIEIPQSHYDGEFLNSLLTAQPSRISNSFLEALNMTLFVESQKGIMPSFTCQKERQN